MDGGARRDLVARWWRRIWEATVVGEEGASVVGGVGGASSGRGCVSGGRGDDYGGWRIKEEMPSPGWN